MDDLMQWLGEQLDGDERIAREAASRQAGGSEWEFADMHVRAGDGAPVTRHAWVGEGTHIARHDPARVLREIDAKRRILAEVVPEIDAMEARIDGEWGAGDPGERESVALLRLLALPYADRPGYREGWRP